MVFFSPLRLEEIPEKTQKKRREGGQLQSKDMHEASTCSGLGLEERKPNQVWGTPG